MTTNSRATTALAMGSALSGILAYVLFIAITRGLGADVAAPVTVLWTYWAFAGAAFTFPLQHWTTRTVAADGASAVRRAMPRLVLLVGTAAFTLGALAWLAREDLFHRPDAWFPLMVILVTLGSALIGATRGALSASGRFTAVALSLVAENGLRCVIVAVLLVSDVSSPVAYGLALVAGHLVVALWPSTLRFGREQAGAPRSPVGPIGFLTGAAVAQLISHAVLTGGPVVLALSGGSPQQVTSLFAALALFRAPYMLALGAVSQVTLRITQHRLSGDSGRVRRMVGVLLVATIVSTGFAGLGAAWLGPALLRLVFGASVVVEPGHAALLAMGCSIAVANLVLVVVALAHDRPRTVAATWLIALGAGALTFAILSPSEPVLATALCFLASECVALVGLLVMTWHAIRSSARPQAETTARGPTA